MSNKGKWIEKEIKTFLPEYIIDGLRLMRFFSWKFIWAVGGRLLPQKYKDIPRKESVYWVNPEKIVYRTLGEFDIYKYNGKVLDGSWDILKKKFEKSQFYKSICARINDKKEWSELEYYQGLLKSVSEGEITWGCKTKEDVDKRCRRLDTIYKDIKKNGYKPNRFGDEITVNIGRHGDLLFNNGRHRLTFCKILKIKEIPTKITVRHSKWVKFRNEIASYAKNSGGEVYAPLTHIDLQCIPSSNTDKRFILIKNNLSVKKGTLLDIGSNWGYFCHKFEEEGFQCYSVENDPINLYFLKKLRRAENRQFSIVSESIFSFCNCEKKREFDVVLALAIFHHFLKRKATFHKFIELLENLEMKEMFFQPHRLDEPQMDGAFKNFDCDEFTEFILEHSCLTTSKMIGNDEHERPIYKLTK